MSDDPEPTPPASGGGSNPAGGCVSGCPCQTDFVVTAPCKIVKSDGGTVTLSASSLPGVSGGSYTWATSSSNISLSAKTGSSVTVTSLAGVSASRDAETITVTRSQTGCGDVNKTVDLTVARLKFLKSTNQRYGFDDFDTLANHDDDHVCVKRSDHTFVRVLIEGGVNSNDFNFETDDTAKASPAAAVAVAVAGKTDFDLKINGGATNKAATKLKARVKCPSKAVFREIDVHTYKEREVKVVVGKFHDSKSAGTNLRFGTADYAAHQSSVNPKLKEAVVKFDITNFDSANKKTDVKFDLTKNNALSYNMAANDGGSEFKKITAAFKGARTTGRVRVAIVRTINFYYPLDGAVKKGEKSIKIAASAEFYLAGEKVDIGTGAKKETIEVASTSGKTINLVGPLKNDHADKSQVGFIAGGVSSDPILIEEGSNNLTTLKWTIPHEVGHRSEGLGLSDIVDTDNFMHFQQSWTDYRLRYCPRSKKYEAGTENQWELIPR